MVPKMPNNSWVIFTDEDHHKFLVKWKISSSLTTHGSFEDEFHQMGLSLFMITSKLSH